MQDAHHALLTPRRIQVGAFLLGAAVVLTWGLAAMTAVAASLDQASLVPDAGEASGPSVSSPVGDLHYTPGRGLQVGHTGLSLGGYANVNLTRFEGGPAEIGSDDVSLFVVWDPIARLHLFSELEVEDLAHVDDHGRGGTPDSTFVAERLYGDFTVSDQVNLRVGKFLTPVGRWNLIHAQPLVWTTSRPLTTELPFDAHTTGAMLFGSLLPDDTSVTYAVYGQFVNALDRLANDLHPADRSAGLRLEYCPAADWAVGGSYLASRTGGEWDHLFGVDTLWQRGVFEVMGEAVVEDGTGALQEQWGLYLQGVLHVLPRVSLVGRYEHFDQRPPGSELNSFVLGLAFKPVPYLILKTEYLFADRAARHLSKEEARRETPAGFSASAAILF
jgi:hypothetical protein